MSRRYTPATEGEMDRLMLICPPVDGPMRSTARALTDDEDDLCSSPHRAAVLDRLGVVRLRGRR